MKRLGVACITVVCLTVVSWSARGQDVSTSTKDIMIRLHKGSGCLLATLGKELKSTSPPWPDVQKDVHEFVVLGQALGHNEPPRGDKGSWARLTGQYLENARAMEQAAQKQDKKGTLDARSRILGSCKTCHNAHKPT
jgi:hypothetical protein